MHHAGVCTSPDASSRPLGKCYEKKYVIATMKYPPSQLKWGDMSCYGAAGPYSVQPDTAINGPKYVCLHVHGCTIFWQNGASYHRSKIATEILNKNKISVLEWPANSPDRSTIENRWTIMKDMVAYKQPSSAENLRLVIKKMWVTEITRSTANSWYQACRVASSKGGHTKY